ncbi:MAG: type II toxin-antitoxin system VapC family toxin [Nocardiopsaceae bacterium]|nr:type II toxin-antitoxin system VapC family toxin [Nocardiopsaceae bacterium]
MIYLDSAAIVKLIHSEPESGDLDAWLTEHIGMPRLTSALAEVEVPRAILRCAPGRQQQILAVMGTIIRIRIGDPVRALAASYKDPMLRSLDAIHLATAQLLASGTEEAAPTFVTYDKRLRAAAKESGLPVASPGAAAA